MNVFEASIECDQTTLLLATLPRSVRVSDYFFSKVKRFGPSMKTFLDSSAFQTVPPFDQKLQAWYKQAQMQTKYEKKHKREDMSGCRAAVRSTNKKKKTTRDFNYAAMILQAS